MAVVSPYAPILNDGINKMVSNLFPPTVTSIDPVEGPVAGGTTVTITGSELDDVTGVTFGGTPGTALVIVNATSVTIDTPSNSPGAVDVVVTDPHGSATLTNAYTYVAGP